MLAAALEAVPAAQKGSILFWDEVFQTLHVSHVIGYDDPRASKATFPVTRGYAARCARYAARSWRRFSPGAGCSA